MKTAEKPVQTTKLSSKTIVMFKQHIKKHLKDEEFQFVFLNFFESNYERQALSISERNCIRKYFKDILVHLFGDYTNALISWEQYCLSMKNIRAQDWDLSKQKIARKMLSELNHYIIKNTYLDTEGYTELIKNQEFLIWEERSTRRMNNHLFEKIGTNFPLGSSIDQLHFFFEGQLKIKKNETSVASILNLNISNGEIKNLLVGFFLNELRPEPALRHFIYLFRYSLMGMGKDPQSITDFTFEVFEKQFEFYEKANKENIANSRSRSEKYRFTIYLVRFYLYLCKIIKDQNIQHKIFVGTRYNEQNIAYYEGKNKGISLRIIKLTSVVNEHLKQHIKDHLKDEEIKLLFLKFFEDVYSQQVFSDNDRWAIQRYFEQWLITIFYNYTIVRISWEQYCLSMKSIRVQNWCDHGKRMARKMLSDLYHYIIENVYLGTKILTELNENKEFLIWEERKSFKMNDALSEYLLDRIGTNFALDSSLDQVHLIPGNDKRFPIILNVNISNDEIKNLLLGFYHNEVNQENTIRLFIYLFKYSLFAVNKELRYITDFCFEVFRKQYRFYQKANILNSSSARDFTIHLTRFYVYLCKIIKEQNINHNIFEGTLFNENNLSSNAFSLYYERGYRLLAYNPFEGVPAENRWLIISPDGYARKNYHYGIDFLEVKDKSFREELKHYVWHQTSMSVSTVATSIYMVIEFLNFISNYKKTNEIDGFLNADLLEQWGFYIDSKEPSTKNSYVKRCRAYLKFYRDKFQIPSLLIDILQQRRLEDDGGTPMTKHDIDLFSKKFQEQRKQGAIGELSYIIFNLAATTKLRSGEILNLERNCILEKSEQTGVIQYHSKTTGEQKIKATLTIEKINLIENAIRLTADAHSKASGDTAKYIFIKEDGWRKDRIIEIVYQFVIIFSKIQKELEGQLDNKYRPNNLRTTFINNIYTEGIKDGLPSKVIAEMAGNGEKTAIKYYRKTSAAQEYAEMFAGVTVSGVDVYGNILEEKDVDELNPVEDGLGGCKQEGCINDEEEYQCLICHHFATTINRKPLFKERITVLKSLKESTLNNQKRNVIDAQLKLYTAYYLKLLIRGEENVTED